ncbi:MULTISPECIES: VOC family protein [Kordiimonas]|uniref:VOC family protein n=1 Tax=Kordiimonas TaxID=288021 RepID=UPI00257D690F|nr:VOC family protein [Kordiimonas sp. UBA4487]
MTLKAIIGDYRAFFARQMADLGKAGFVLDPMPVSHLAFRTRTYAEYLAAREALEAHAIANVENVWRGRPISKILLEEPLELDDQHEVRLIELIPPVHLADYPMGLEHVGLVVGETFDDFCHEHEDRFAEFQDQGPYCQPHLVTFESGCTVKFYRHSLMDVVIKEGRRFDDFHHAPWDGD